LGEQPDATHLPKGQLTRLEGAVARAIIWHRYWQENKSLLEISNEVSKSKPFTYTLCRAENDDISAYVDELQWKIDLTPVGTNYYGFSVADQKSLAQGDSKEATRSYLAALSRETNILAKGGLVASAKDLSVLTFDKPSQKQFRTVTNLIATHLSSAKWLNEERIKKGLRGPLTVHVGGFNNESAWVYYRVEGIPYVGMTLYDPLTGEFIHDDVMYIDQIPGDNEYRNVSRAIDKDGTTFSLK